MIETLDGIEEELLLDQGSQSDCQDMMDDSSSFSISNGIASQTDVEVDQEDKVNDEMDMGQFNKERTVTDELVAKLLCRWWYVLPEWPPKNFNYQAQLEARKLKVYKVEEFEDAENVDLRGYTKVYQISAFPGVYRDFTGKAHDLRPMEGRPCYSNLVKLSQSKLVELIQTAIETQLEILKASSHDESETIKTLQEVNFLYMPCNKQELGTLQTNF
ncbi:hypothetical protein BdWA1_002820 [Babesia duncani]|uniref:Uncharacterized protein n=1 Tax=Babesia duncani TaxID=323732 RepID=A0AAD9PJX0_9APIC|nr:hypothetical protein BdWA1_002820 [Babesia duncani]